MCELQRNDVKETLSLSHPPFKYASGQRRGFKSVDVTVTEAVIPSVPRWILKKHVRILTPSRTPEHYMSQLQCTFKSNKLKVSGALKAFHLNCYLYVRDSRPSQ